jgi:hypothetical protein
MTAVYLSRGRPTGDQAFQFDQARLSLPPCMFKPAHRASRMRKNIGQPIETCLIGIDTSGNLAPRVGAPYHHDAHNPTPDTLFLSKSRSKKMLSLMNRL